MKRALILAKAPRCLTNVGLSTLASPNVGLSILGLATLESPNVTVTFTFCNSYRALSGGGGRTRKGGGGALAEAPQKSEISLF